MSNLTGLNLIVSGELLLAVFATLRFLHHDYLTDAFGVSRLRNADALLCALLWAAFYLLNLATMTVP